MGDKVAIRIVERIVDETVISAYNLMKKLDLLNEETPVVIAGVFIKVQHGFQSIFRLN